MRRTIKGTVDQIVNGYSRNNGPTVEQRIRQCCEAVAMLPGLLPSQCEAAHVLASAYRIEAQAQQAVLAWQGRGPGPESDDADCAALDAADAVADAEDNFLRLCGGLEVEVPLAP
jgi:hypothetical protein